jgi:uncharacterized protein (DUF433 family)
MRYGNDSEKGEWDMSPTAPKMDYPYITSNPEIAGGRPIIAGTRIAVHCIAGYYQTGMRVDEILDSLRHLTPSQVHSALAYYFDTWTRSMRSWKKRATANTGRARFKRIPRCNSDAATDETDMDPG